MGACKHSRFTANGSFGGTNPSGARIVAITYTGSSGCRPFVRVGSMTLAAAGAYVEVMHNLKAGQAAPPIHICEDGVPIQKRGYCKVSGSLTQVDVFWRNL